MFVEVCHALSSLQRAERHILLISSGGAVSFQGWDGAFSGFKTMEFWVKRNDAGIPDFSLQISSTSKVKMVPFIF